MSSVQSVQHRVWEARRANRIAKQGLRKARSLGDRCEQYHYWKMLRSTSIQLSRALDALNRHKRKHYA